MDLSMLKDRRFIIAAVAVAALGAGVWYSRRKSGSSSAVTPTGSTTATPAGTVYSSTGTDVAAWLGDYSSSLQSQLTSYNSALADQIKALQDITKPAATSPAAQPGYARVETWWDADQWITNLLKTSPEIFGGNVGNAEAWKRIAALNPEITANVSPTNQFKTGAVYKLPGTG